MCLFGELVNLRHPGVVQGKGELGSVWAHGSGAPFEPQWPSGGVDVTQDHPGMCKVKGGPFYQGDTMGPESTTSELSKSLRQFRNLKKKNTKKPPQTSAH